VSEVASSGRRVQVAVAIFALLLVVVVGGDAIGWLETPLAIGTGDESGAKEAKLDLRATRAACRFGVALSRAGTRGRTRIDAEALADAYADGFNDLPARNRARIREACLDGVRTGLRARNRRSDGIGHARKSLRRK
jgi:hypothetical protein